MMYVVQVDQKSLRATSDPLPPATALRVAKAWQSHGDRGVRIVEGDGDAADQRSWSIRDFMAFAKRSNARETRGRQATDGQIAQAAIKA